MCRLLLMNASAFDLIDHDLEPIFNFLVVSFGGHGNGVAALWPDGTTRVAKSVYHDEIRSAHLLRRYRRQGASWFLFHTRHASVGKVQTSNCHPFRQSSGNFVLAHNGHDPDFAHWARYLAITDSEYIARTWAKLRLPLHALQDVRGVFVGFQHGKPFVVKGAHHTDLVALWQTGGDAIVLASELPPYAYQYDAFDAAAPLGRVLALGQEDIVAQLNAFLFPVSSFSPSSSTSYHHASPGWDAYLEPLEEDDNASDQWLDEDDASQASLKYFEAQLER